MGLSEERKDGAVRLSWCHLTELPDLAEMVKALACFSHGGISLIITLF